MFDIHLYFRYVCTYISCEKLSTEINGLTIVFNATMSCTSKSVIYVLTCLGCLKLYVGETGTALNLQVNTHRQHINRPEYSRLFVSDHLRACGGSFSIIPVFQMQNNSVYLRRKQEKYFINILKPALNSFFPPQYHV